VEIDIQTAADLRRLRELAREYALLKEEHTLLKKAIRFCSERKQRSSSSWTDTEGSTEWG
jgi:transposase